MRQRQEIQALLPGSKESSTSSSHGAASISETLRKALEGQQFNTLEEVQAFLGQVIQQKNRQPLDEFHGLSPEQMHRILDFPFTSPGLVRFPEALDTIPAAPILTLFELLANAIGEQGLKPTAKGNLPRNFCREAAQAYWGEQQYQENTRFGGINREEDFTDLQVTRLVAELAGLIRKHKGRFILSRDCRRLLVDGGMSAIYPRLFRAHVEEFNWACRDRYPDLRFMQVPSCSHSTYLPAMVTLGSHRYFMKTPFWAPFRGCWMKCHRARYFPSMKQYAPLILGALWCTSQAFWA